MERLLKSHLPQGKFNVSPQRSRAMAAVRGRGNRTTELRLQMALVRSGLSGWSIQRTDLPGKPDFFFPKATLAVFVDGCFWHGCAKCGHIPKTNNAFWAAKIARNNERHRKISRLLKNKGVRTIRLWEHQLRDNLDGCIARIRTRVAKH